MGSFRTDRRNRRLSWAVGVSLALATGSVLADAPKTASTTQPSGLMTFPNVKVVNVAPIATASAKHSKSAGMRAAVDPVTKQLRPLTTEDSAQIAAESKAKAQAKSLSRARGASLGSDDVSADAEVELFYTEGGFPGAQLTEDTFVYQVAHKSSSGIAMEEATGKVAADKAARASAQKKAGVSNDR